MSESLIVPLSEPDAQKRLGTCARGFSDRFGDRLLTIDRESATPLELLRFKPELSDSPAFETGLRLRVERAQVQNLAIASPRSVERWNGGLVLVSRNAAGRRLSETPINGRGALMALDFLRQVTPALSALAEADGRFGHGALTLDRVVATHDGRLALVEHALGAAVEQLGWSAARLQSELGLAVPPAETPAAFDSRIDPIQLGFVALSLVLGRRVDAAEYPNGIPKLLDECAKIKGNSSAAARLRAWLERALQIGSRPFESVGDALSALSELPADTDLSRVEPAAPVAPPAASKPALVVPIAPPAPKPVPVAAAPAPLPRVVPPAPVVAPAPVAPRAAVVPAPSPVLRPTPAVAAVPVVPPSPVVPPPAIVPLADAAPVGPEALTPVVVAAKPARRSAALKWALVAMSALAVAEGAVLARQWYFAPAPVPAAASAAVEDAAATPPPVVVQAAARPAVELPPAAAPPRPAAERTAETPAPAAASAASGAPRFGGVTFVSPLELQVFEGGKRIGASGGPIAILEGAHSVELVNESLGFRQRETVTVKPGEMLSRTVPLPTGRLSINATPWADVWIDGNAAGQTPLANVSLPIGEHQITFRHPQFGEQRQTALVKVEGVTRLSVGFQR